MEKSPLVTNPVFGALARPAMAGGVTLDYHIFNLTVSMCLFILMSPPWILVFVPLHLFGWTVTRYDMHFFSVISKKITLPPMPNSNFHGVRVYEPF